MPRASTRCIRLPALFCRADVLLHICHHKCTLHVKDGLLLQYKLDVKLQLWLVVFLLSDFLILPGFIDFTSDEVVSAIAVPQLTLTGLFVSLALFLTLQTLLGQFISFTWVIGG